MKDFLILYFIFHLQANLKLKDLSINKTFPKKLNLLEKKKLTANNREYFFRITTTIVKFLNIKHSEKKVI